MSLLLTVQAAAVAVANDAVPAGTQVFDGPLPAKSTPPRKFLLIGSDGGSDGTGNGEFGPGASAAAAPSSLSGPWLDEEGEVLCASWAWNGGTDLAPVRADAYAAAQALASALRADPTLGGVLANGGRAWPSEISVEQAQTSKGAVARCVLSVGYSGLVTA